MFIDAICPIQLVGKMRRTIDRFDSSPADHVICYTKKMIWNQKLGDQENPYLTRWALVTRFGSLRLHKWRCGDDDRNFHDHPWWFITIVLKGSYIDISPHGEDHLRRFSVRFRPAHHRHTVKTDGAWTLLVTGPQVRTWGFWIPKKNKKMKFIRAREYFFRFGHHQCD